MALNALALQMKDHGWLIDHEARKRHAVRLGAAIEAARQRFAAISGLSLSDAPVDGDGADQAVASGNADEADDDIAVFVNSAPQLKSLFFDKWGVRPKYFSKGTGTPSLDKNALKDLLAEGHTEQIRLAARALLDYRESHKTKSTYVDRLDPESKDKRGHPNTYLTLGDNRLRATPQPLQAWTCLLYTSPSPRDLSTSRMPSSA